VPESLVIDSVITANEVYLCANSVSDDTPAPDAAEATVRVNDGCPAVGAAETAGTKCNNGLDDDNDGFVNDGCIRAGTYDDCDTNGDGDCTDNIAAAQPGPTVAQTCSDGIDNDDDGATDGGDSTGGTLANSSCDTADYAAIPDGDYDGVPNATDNCPTAWNPTQTNTDLGKGAWAAGGMPAGDGQGDACDDDDDADGYVDVVENYLPSDPLDRCTNGMAGPVYLRSDSWPLDISLDTVATAADVLKFAGKIGCKPSGSSCGAVSTPPASWQLSRLDFNKDDTVTAADVLKFAGRIGQDCDNAP
jgi:hypothetical protein